jgi:endonuclease/exonuclease/phosphatase family metal-dependent hydrolase
LKNRPAAAAIRPPASTVDRTLKLRVLSYNIHGCVDARRNVNPFKIAEVIGAIDADVVALQEVDAEKPLKLNKNQARTIGELIDLGYTYYPVEKTGLHEFGLAVLSRFPVEQSGFTLLPHLYPKLNPRKRGVMRVSLRTPAGKIQLINTHLSLFSLERENQLRMLLNWNKLSEEPSSHPIILCGDLNAGPSSSTYYRLSRHLTDAHKSSNHYRPPRATFHARTPFLRIDHIFTSEHFTALNLDVIRTTKTMAASDHLPLVADLNLSCAWVPEAEDSGFSGTGPQAS